MRDVRLLAITRLFNERGRVDAGAKDRCETFNVYWRRVFTNGSGVPRSNNLRHRSARWLLTEKRAETLDFRRHMRSRRLIPDSSLPPTAIHYHIPKKQETKAMFYV